MGKAAKGKSKGGGGKPVEDAEETEEQKVQVVEEIFEAILQAVHAAAYENYLKRREIPFTVDHVLDTLETLVAFSFSEPDTCESLEHLEAMSKMAATEPLPAPIDSSAPGMVPTKAIEITTKTDIFESINGEGSRLPSESGRSKTRSVRSKTYRSVGSKRSQGRDGAGGQRKRGKAPDYIIHIEEDDPFDQHRRPSAATLKLQDEETPREGPLEVEQDAEKKKALEEEKRAELDRQRKLAKELDGKEYAVDHAGNVIIVKAVNGDKLPKNRIEPPHALKPAELEDEVKQPERKKLQSDQATRLNSAGSETEANNRYYKSAVSFQQQILKNPELRIEAGVHIKEGGLGRAGPKRTHDARQMSRERFLAHQSLLESQTIPSLGGPSLAHTDPNISSQQDEATSKNEEKKRIEEEEMLSKDPNVELVRSADWGKNPSPKSFLPAVLPANKPSSKQNRSVKSHRLRTQIASSSKSRMIYNLPPPSGPSETSVLDQQSLLASNSSATKPKGNGKVTFTSTLGRNVLGIDQAVDESGVDEGSVNESS